MNRIAFLSADNLEGYVSDDDLCRPELAKVGWDLETVSWRQADIDWSLFAGAIIRSTWDYHRNLPAFLKSLEAIASATRLANPLNVVRWNAEKTYLRDLQEIGVRTVPVLWRTGPLEADDPDRWFEELDTDEVVIKPTVSANAEHTFRVRKGTLPPDLLSIFRNRSYMVQSFVPTIVDEGEFSLFYFSDRFSHAILKTPKLHDFRVQEEHGGVIRATQLEEEILAAGEKIVGYLSPTPLYARVDFVRDEGEFALMELELIEPSLYLRTEQNAPARFAAAIVEWLSSEPDNDRDWNPLSRFATVNRTRS